MTLEQTNKEAPEFSGIAAKFPKTSWTLLDAMRADSDGAAKARSEFARLYYHPIHAFFCAAVKKAEGAEDLAQEFFEVAIVAGTVLQRADRATGNFRLYLLEAMRNFLKDKKRWAARKRRRAPSGEIRIERLPQGGEGVLPEIRATPERAYGKAWAQALLDEALGKVQRLCMSKGQREHFDLFTRYYLSRSPERPSWEALAKAFGLKDGKQARSRADTVVGHLRLIVRRLMAQGLGPEQSVDEELAALHVLLDEDDEGEPW